MNKNQRLLGRIHQKHFEVEPSENVGEDRRQIREVLPPKHRRSELNKFTTNKCCYIAPDRMDFGQITEDVLNDMYQATIKHQDTDKCASDMIAYLEELRRLLCNNLHKVDHSMQCSNAKVSDMGATDSSQNCWQTIDHADDIDKYIDYKKGSLDSFISSPKSVTISETPQIKIIANKFARFKKKSIELRKLEEKVVCLEYDVYLKNGLCPVQKLRAFFSVKPMQESGDNELLHVISIPSTVKNKFNIANEDFNNLNEKEIEIIDEEIEENKTYLNDLRRILRRKQAVYNKRNKSSLDLVSLYQMAKRQSPAFEDYSNTNFLSKAELEEIKDLIIKKCASSVHGINRRTLKKGDDTCRSIGKDIEVISQSILAELWREGSTVYN
ncbi:hypothetical protein ACJJTC_007291 [Scirpophaga incertulas]